MALLLSAIAVLSCEKDSSRNVNPGRNTGINIAADVINAAEYIETKSGAIAELKNVYGEPGDDFIITEYVTDIEATLPGTKGTEIKNANFGTKYGRFHTQAYVGDDLKFSLDAVAPSWGWDGDAPKWINLVDYSIWSYAPASMESGLTVTKDQITFTHSVPAALEAQQDLIFAHNEERRSFNDPATNTFKVDESDPEKKSTFDVKFYHALSAVKFVLDVTDTQTAAAADVHSITLCYIDPDTHQIVTSNAGIATTGDCTVTSSGSGSFDWDNVGTRKPLHYEFNDTYPRTSSCVANDYCNTGDGVMFMIPQTATDISVIVEFSKYGGEDLYYTKVKKLNDINWQAGKYYTYKLQIGEFHVPGELLAANVDLKVQHFASAQAQNLWSNDFTQKGIKKVGVIIDGYLWGGNQSGTLDLFVSNGTPRNVVPDSSPFQYNFLDTNVPSTPEINVIYKFGLNGSGTETYDTHYTYTTSTSKTETKYYVFDVESALNNSGKFNIQMYTTSNNNGASFTAPVRCMMVLEVNSDTLPSNFSTIDWDNI